MLSVTHLSCARGDRTLFADLSFSLAEREWLHVKGRNGAGKTTLLRALVGLAPPQEGEVRWRGEPAPSEAFRRDLIYLGHHAAVKEELTPVENLRLSAAIDGIGLSERDLLAALIRMGLRGREELPVRVLSAGQKRRVLLARLLTRPAKLWVLDEAFNALDTAAVTLLGELVQAHLDAGGLAVLTSHQALPVTGGRELVL